MRVQKLAPRTESPCPGVSIKNLSPAAKVTPIRIYIVVSTNNFVRLQIVCRPRARMTGEARPPQNGSVGKLSGHLLPEFGLTTHTTHITHHFRRTCRPYHAYHAYHAPISVGPAALTTHITHITHHFRQTCHPYHAYHAYHAPFPSDLPPLPRISRISRTISVGLATTLKGEIHA